MSTDPPRSYSYPHLARHQLRQQRIPLGREGSRLNGKANVLGHESADERVSRSDHVRRRDGHLCVSEMVPLDVAHCCRLGSRDGAEVIQVLADSAPIEPLWEIVRSDLEQVLVQGASAVSPKDQFKAARPGKQEITVLNNVSRFKFR